ncbi:UNVERIFIED_CONTAM: hypothetical protein H355_012571 [Colinus virginianus]|nr:hypothetical protein H355_012571 [Colinus virginianus]
MGTRYAVPARVVWEILWKLLGYVGHSPTKTRAPAYTFRGTKMPRAESCGPGPCYSVEPAISRTGKYVIPGSYLQGRPKSEIAITPGPSDYRIEAANRHVFKCPPVQSMAFRREPVRTDRPPVALHWRSALPREAPDSRLGSGGVTLIKPQAPACTFGIRHSIYTAPLITE